MLTERQDNLLKVIINEYIKTARPIGSALLVDKYNLDCSSATVRNEMLELDHKGYLRQPHTSAGRIPTEIAYRRFLESKFRPNKLTSVQKRKLDNSLNTGTDRHGFKSLAKAMSDLSGEFILTAFADNDFFYTGLTNLFSQPEFGNQNIVCNVSTVIDHLDRHLSKLFHKVDNDVKVLVGSENPIDPNLTLMTTKHQNGLLISILGPMRMEYGLNISILEYCKHI